MKKIDDIHKKLDHGLRFCDSLFELFDDLYGEMETLKKRIVYLERRSFGDMKDE